jgi:signal transduction histidine kinase
MERRSAATVLVVDDEPAHCQLMELVLRRQYTVRTACSVQDALRWLDTTQFDVALVDYGMPGTPGTHLLELLRERQPGCLRFLITAYGEAAVLRDAINRSQIYRFIAKPLEPEQLSLDISRALEYRDTREQLRRAESLAVLGRLAGSVVHDLRNYLVVLRIAPDLLESATDRAAVSDIAGRIRHVEHGIYDLVEELLSLARGVPPRYELAEASLADLVESAASLARYGDNIEQRTILVHIEPGLPALRLSPSRCARMLHNLVRNAIEATPADGVIELRLRRDGERHVALEVCDDGCGVPAEVLPRIFDPLFTTKGSAGVGFGLAMCRTVAQGHGGSIECHSEVGKGATFVVRFPL